MNANSAVNSPISPTDQQTNQAHAQVQIQEHKPHLDCQLYSENQPSCEHQPQLEHQPYPEPRETFSIGQAARMLGIPSSTLRFYEKEHLLPHIDRTSTGLRRYHESDLRLVQMIECLKATGMPLTEIRGFVDLVEQGDVSIDARLEFFHRQQRRLEEQKAALQAQQNALDFKVWYYSCAQQAGTTQAPERLLLRREKQRPELLRIDGIDTEPQVSPQA